MLVAMFIFRDDEFQTPIYADGELDELDGEVRDTLLEAIQEALQEDGSPTEVEQIGDFLVGWHVATRSGLSFACVVEDEEGEMEPSMVGGYLAEVYQRYVDEVDEARYPDSEGVADVMVDVIPPWED